jgi:bifunctional non-homologous end joining protein LigD
MRHRYKPMLAKVAEKSFTDKNWIFEVKWDGFRAIAYIDSSVSLRSRNNKELIGFFPELKELDQLTHDVVLDGEIIILKKGKVDFQALLERRRANSKFEMNLRTEQSPAVYVVFDILEKDGKSLMDIPLMQRKEILKTALKEGEHVLLEDYVEEKGEAYYQATLQKGLEGIIAKKKGSLYEPGLRSGNWMKIKKLRSCDCVIFGYTRGEGAREKAFGALLLGLYDEQQQPVYIGKVGTGFSQETLEKLMRAFEKIPADNAPFNLETSENVNWLKPKLVCEVVYQVLTKDGRLRMPRFQGLRSDKSPIECTLDQLETRVFPLQEYQKKRDFGKTKEPKGKGAVQISEGNSFVVQEHHSRRLHYDFRLERGGVLKSWAVPKGIPDNNQEKRLAVATEDHPLEYAKFEGEIPKGEYGAGKVIIWDKGIYETKVWSQKMIEVNLKGDRLKGTYVLVPLKRAGEKNWLMLKAKV